MTAAVLLATDPDQIRQVAGYYRAAAASIAVRGDELDATTTTLHGAWSGAAQRSAATALAGVRARLIAATMALTSVDQALSEFAETLVVTRRLIGGEALGAVGRSLRMAEAADTDTARRLGAAGDWFGPMAATAGVPAVGSDPVAVFSWWSALSPARSSATLITSGPRI